MAQVDVAIQSLEQAYGRGASTPARLKFGTTMFR